MKKTILFIVVLFTSIVAIAQAPQSFKYQAIIRNSSGDVITNQDVGLQISILEGSDTGPSVYSETWLEQTNQFGLITINIGEGETSQDFSSIPWSTGNYWIKTEVDVSGGTNYTELGTSQLLSVPFAFYSSAVANGTGITPWLLSDGNIYYNAGNVGIGTDSPNARLEVKTSGFAGDTFILCKRCRRDSRIHRIFRWCRNYRK
jgi:hypothetical protein